MNRKIVTDKNSSDSNFIYRFLSYWPLFLVLFIISIACAWTYLKLAKPIYEVNARILIKDETNVSEDAKAVDSIDLISLKRKIDNEMEIIQSKTLLNSVVKDLNLNAPIFEKKKFTTISAYISSPIKIFTDSITLKETKQVFFKVKNNNVVINNIAYPLNKWVNTPYGMLAFKKNIYAIEPQNDKQLYFSLISANKIVADLASKLKITAPDKMSNILNIHLTDEVPVRGQNIINDLIKVYDQSVIDEKSRLTSNTAVFINEHIQKVENELLGTEQKLRNYKSNRGGTDLGAQGKAYLQNVSTNDQQISEINTKLWVLNQVGNYVNSKYLANGIIPSTVGINDASLTQMIKDIDELKNQSESLKTNSGENNPLYLSCINRINTIKTRVLENLLKQKASLQASLQNISNTNNNYASLLQSMPPTQRELIDVNRAQNIERGQYAFLLQKKEEMEFSYVSNIVGSKIIYPAEAVEHPIIPKKKFVYLGSLLAALIFGIGIVGGRGEQVNKIDAVGILQPKKLGKQETTPFKDSIEPINDSDELVIKQEEVGILQLHELAKLETIQVKDSIEPINDSDELVTNHEEVGILQPQETAEQEMTQIEDSIEPINDSNEPIIKRGDAEILQPQEIAEHETTQIDDSIEPINDSDELVNKHEEAEILQSQELAEHETTQIDDSIEPINDSDELVNKHGEAGNLQPQELAEHETINEEIELTIDIAKQVDKDEDLLKFKDIPEQQTIINEIMPVIGTVQHLEKYDNEEILAHENYPEQETITNEVYDSSINDAFEPSFDDYPSNKQSVEKETIENEIDDSMLTNAVDLTLNNYRINKELNEKEISENENSDSNHTIYVTPPSHVVHPLLIQLIKQETVINESKIFPHINNIGKVLSENVTNSQSVESKKTINGKKAFPFNTTIDLALYSDTPIKEPKPPISTNSKLLILFSILVAAGIFLAYLKWFTNEPEYTIKPVHEQPINTIGSKR